jgi:uncharacterized protein involved in type VI secretion and phage assembly
LPVDGGTTVGLADGDVEHPSIIERLFESVNLRRPAFPLGQPVMGARSSSSGENLINSTEQTGPRTDDANSCG